MKLLSAQGRRRSFVPDASFQTPNVMAVKFSMARVAKTNRRDTTGDVSRPGKVPRASELPDAASATRMALVPPTPEVLRKIGQAGLERWCLSELAHVVCRLWLPRGCPRAARALNVRANCTDFLGCSKRWTYHQN